MGWESRKGTSRRYYTRSRRVDGRVVREYVGSGPAAEAAAALDAARRCEREEQRRIHKEELAEVKAVDEMMGEVARLSGEHIADLPGTQKVFEKTIRNLGVIDSDEVNEDINEIRELSRVRIRERQHEARG